VQARTIKISRFARPAFWFSRTQQLTLGEIS
jgi:hypothetical protein